MFDLARLIDSWTEYSETNECYLNTGYFFAAFRDHPGLIRSPISIKIMDNSSYTVNYENVILDLQSTTPHLFLVEIKSGNFRHCNALILDLAHNTAYRLEPEINSVYDQLIDDIVATTLRLIVAKQAELKGVTYPVDSMVITSIKRQTDKVSEETLSKTCGDSAGYCVADIIYGCSKYCTNQAEQYMDTMDIHKLRKLSSMLIANLKLDDYYKSEEHGKYMGWGSVGRYRDPYMDYHHPQPHYNQDHYRSGPIYQNSYHPNSYQRPGMFGSLGSLLVGAFGGFILGSILN